MKTSDTSKDEALLDVSLTEISQALLEALDAFTSAASWRQAKHVVEMHPELLSEKVDALLHALIKRQKDRRIVRALRAHREMLARCRAEGIEAAFADYVADEAQDWLVAPDPDRASDADTYDVLTSLIAEHPEVLPVLRHRLREVLDPQEMALINAIEAFLTADTWHQAKQRVRAHPELLTLDADIWLMQYGAFIEARGDVEVAGLLADRRWLLARCRAVGIDRAFQGRVLSSVDYV
jgi:hypothetical protein